MKKSLFEFIIFLVWFLIISFMKDFLGFEETVLFACAYMLAVVHLNELKGDKNDGR